MKCSIEGIFYWILNEIERAGYLSPETVEDIRHTPEYKDLYERRKETIERVFADAKEKHAMRYTPYRGLSQVTNWVRLKFAAMNLKKYAIHRWNRSHYSIYLTYIFQFFTNRYFKTLNLN